VASACASILANSGAPGSGTAVKLGRSAFEFCQAQARARQTYPVVIDKLHKLLVKALKLGSGLEGGLTPSQYPIALEFNGKFTAEAIPTPEETLEFINKITLLRANTGSWKTRMLPIFSQLRPFMPREMEGGRRKTRHSKKLRSSRSRRRSHRK
jgi:hypothetical protein